MVTTASGNPIYLNGHNVLNRYDDYGAPQPGNLGRFQYTGQAFLPEIGLFHYRARAYSPTMGRFLQPDPIGYGDDMNMYAYAGNDPINGTDPTGTTVNLVNGVLSSTSDITVIGYQPDSTGGNSSPTLPPGSGQRSTPFAGNVPAQLGYLMCKTDPDCAKDNGFGDYVNGGLTANETKPQSEINASFLDVNSTRTFSYPANGPNPLDPLFLNSPTTPREAQQVERTLSLIMHGDTKQVMNELRPHPYTNFPHPLTGARLPPSPKGYTAFDVYSGGKGGSQGLVYNNTTGSLYYTNNHYQ